MSLARNGARPDPAGDARRVGVATVAAAEADCGARLGGRASPCAETPDLGVLAPGRCPDADLTGAAACGGAPGSRAVDAGDNARADAASARDDFRGGEDCRDGGVTLGARNACNGGAVLARDRASAPSFVVGVAPAADPAPEKGAPRPGWGPFLGWLRFLLRDDLADMGVTSGSSR